MSDCSSSRKVHHEGGRGHLHPLRPHHPLYELLPVALSTEPSLLSALRWAFKKSEETSEASPLGASLRWEN